MHLKVLVIGGGISDEREVSLRSSRVIFKSIDTKKHEVEFYDWDGSVAWLTDSLSKFDVVLPILHGKGGEDGQIQNIFEENGAKYLGSNSLSAKKCFDKELTRSRVKSFGFEVPKGAVMNYQDYLSSEFTKISHVIKPVMGGSSIHTHIINDQDLIDMDQVEETFKIYNELLVEECIVGHEITVAYLEGQTLPVVEIIPPEGKLFDYENKYNGLTTELCPPVNIPQSLQQEAIRMTEQVHNKMSCRHLSRTDIMVKGDKLYFLEINVMPGLTEQSLFPKAAKKAGLDFPELVEYFINIASKQV